MIPSNELRIGNYVQCEGRLERLVMINNKTAAVDVEKNDGDAKGELPLSSIQPVPLTDDILQQCKFVYHDYFKFWQLISGKDELRSEMDIDRDYNVIDFMRRPLVREVASLHQLQNIYFVLKGQELSFQQTAASQP
ncbi:MAG TPA: hypothetical protein VMR70_12535 [Flavisolibacter sp.]|nr:hypothetical protein [Flavisolibacter sp.]